MSGTTKLVKVEATLLQQLINAMAPRSYQNRKQNIWRIVEASASSFCLNFKDSTSILNQVLTPRGLTVQKKEMGVAKVSVVSHVKGRIPLFKFKQFQHAIVWDC